MLPAVKEVLPMLLLVAATTTTNQPNPLVGLLPFLLIGGALYFIMLRPQKKRMEEQRRLQGSVAVGDEILTIGGIFGIVRFIDEDSDELTIEVAPGTTLRIIRSAVARRVVEEDELSDDDTLDDDGDARAEADRDDPEAGEE
jgi:preprotein translocase subunit YajC